MLAAQAADWLAGGKTLDVLSSILLLPALWLSVSAGTDGGALLLGALAIAAGIVEKYFALRVAFDRRVFARWAAQWASGERHEPAAALAEFDAGLVALGLRRESGGRVRPLSERIAGAMGLWRRQAACTALQFGLLVALIGWRGLA